MNELKIFNNEEFGEVRTVLNSDGSISINAEDIIFGLGWTTVATSGNEVGRWSRVNTYCKELGFDKEITKDSFIPESLCYMLAMKANNDTALKFQRWLALEVIPAIRKTGTYSVKSSPEQD